MSNNFIYIINPLVPRVTTTRSLLGTSPTTFTRLQRPRWAGAEGARVRRAPQAPPGPALARAHLLVFLRAYLKRAYYRLGA